MLQRLQTLVGDFISKQFTNNVSLNNETFLVLDKLSATEW